MSRMQKVMPSMKTHRMEYILSGITFFIIVCVIFFNDINTVIRVKQLKILLQKSVQQDNNIDHTGLVMKYRLCKRLYENKISEKDLELSEIKYNNLVTNFNYTDNIEFERYEYLAYPVLKVINAIRSILGKPPIKNFKEDETSANLEIAYYYERNHNYKKALEIYENALDEDDSDRARTAGIILHQGFCNAIIGSFDRAEERYLKVIDDYAEQSASVTAAILLKYLRGFRAEIERVIKTETDSLEKGKKLLGLMAYHKAFDTLGKIEHRIAPADKTRFKYLKARALMGMAEKKKSAEAFQEIVVNDPDSEYAKSSNRRLYLMGTLDRQGDDLKDLAVKNNQIVKDEDFAAYLKTPPSRYDSVGFNDMMEQNEILKNNFNNLENKSPTDITGVGKKLEKKKETAGITVNLENDFSTESGESASFTIKLNSQPESRVTISFKSTDPGEGVPDADKLIFDNTNWNLLQKVRVKGVDDDIADGNTPYYIEFTKTESNDLYYKDIIPEKIYLINRDNDRAAIITKTVRKKSTEKGVSASFTISINSQPKSDVIINFNSSDRGEGIPNIKSVKFTPLNWKRAKTVRVKGLPDGKVDGDRTYYIVFQPARSKDSKYNGIKPDKLAFINIDTDSGKGGKSSKPKVMISTQEGNIFIGDVIEETREYVVLMTLVGDVKIDKKKITNRADMKK